MLCFVLILSCSWAADAGIEDRKRLTGWVQRSYARYPNRNHEMREKIKSVLKPYVDNHTQWQHDWDREPIPVLDGSPNGSRSSRPGEHEHFSRSQTPSRSPPPLIGQRRPAPISESPRTKPNKRHHAPELRIQPQYGKKAKNAAKAAAAVMKKNKNAGRAQQPDIAASSSRVSAREARFQAAQTRAAFNSYPAYDDDDDDWQPNVIVQGRCQELEKDFLRLNGPPDPSKVRPEPVIQRALDRIVDMIARSEQPYHYHWSQLKAMRQDLTVQHIQNETAAAVEEAFARVALEQGDMRNYQKCSTALRVLFDTGVKGCCAEFDAYRILANVCQDHCTADEVLKAMKQAVAHGVGETAEVRHALAVQRTLTLGNSCGFWKLYVDAPHCGRLIMDRAAPAVRLAATRALVSRFKPAADQRFCLAVLGFDLPPRHRGEHEPLQAGCSQMHRQQEAQDLNLAARVEQCKGCLGSFRAVVFEGEGSVQIRAKDNKLDLIVMPDEKDMKGHGHAEVKLTDFKKIVI
jgi:SAC3 family protein LENG8/THP3